MFRGCPQPHSASAGPAPRRGDAEECLRSRYNALGLRLGPGPGTNTRRGARRGSAAHAHGASLRRGLLFRLMVTVSAKACPRQRCTQHTTIATSAGMCHGNVGRQVGQLGSRRERAHRQRPIELIRRNSFPVNTCRTTFPTEPRRGCPNSGITPKWEGANIGQRSVTYPRARNAR
jgi:hypothetical protein